MKKIYVAEPWLSKKDFDFIGQILKNNFVTENKLNSEFEKQFKIKIKSKYATTYSNGTMGLYGAIKSLNIKKGNEIILPNISFIASATSIIAAGLRPVFCDLKKNSFKLDLKKAKSLINKKTSALMCVHLFGYSDEMKEVLSFCKTNKLYLIEDASQALGVKYKKRYCGTFGDANSFSFYGNKMITTGEGAIVTCKNKQIYNNIYRIKNHGRLIKGKYIHETIGYNFAFTEFQAGLGISQLNKLDKIINKKIKIYKRYKKKLSIIKSVAWIEDDKDTNIYKTYWLSNILVKDRSKLEKYLRKYGIFTRRLFYPLNKQKSFKSLKLKSSKLVNSYDLYNKVLTLPSDYKLSNKDQDFVIKKIKDFYL